MGPLTIQKSEQNESYREIKIIYSWVFGGFLIDCFLVYFFLDGRERAALCSRFTSSETINL